MNRPNYLESPTVRAIMNTSLPPLPQNAERRLIERFQKDGDVEARDQLLRANYRFAFKQTGDFFKHAPPGCEFDDLFTEAIAGMAEAIERFDLSRDVKFISYAVWYIKRNHHKHKLDNAVVRTPAALPYNLKWSEFFTAIRGLQTSGQSSENDAALVTMGKRATAKVLSDMSMRRTPLSIDVATWSGQHVEFPTIIDELDRADQGAIIDRMLADLQDRQREVLGLYFGITAPEPMTLEQIGDQMGVTRERVRQIKKKALALLGSRYRDMVDVCNN